MTSVVNWMLRACVLAASIGFLTVPAGSALSAGAMAIGSCAAYGFSYDYGQLGEARSAALGKCAGGQCKVVATIKRNCVAFAIDGRNSCGPHGYAIAPRLGQAENTAMRYCYKYGGKDCVIRAWACDAKG
jgi:hypothetical protein